MGQTERKWGQIPRRAQKITRFSIRIACLNNNIPEMCAAN